MPETIETRLDRIEKTLDRVAAIQELQAGNLASLREVTQRQQGTSERHETALDRIEAALDRLPRNSII